MRFNDSLWMVRNQKPILPFFGGIQYLNTSELLPSNTKSASKLTSLWMKAFDHAVLEMFGYN